MNKYLLTLGVLCAINVSKAQDVIVKKDGSTVVSKVLEVNQDDIKYKKYSNLDGPTYTIYKKEIASINYENGDRDLFGDKEDSQQSVSSPKGQSDQSKQRNKSKIDAYNQFTLKYKSDIIGKDAKRAYFAMAFSENSVIENEDLSCSVDIGQLQLGEARRGASSQAQFSKSFSRGLYYYFFTNQALLISLANNSDKTIYVDLANSFYRRGNEASPYYVPTAVSTMNSSTTGASIGIPTVFGGIGLGHQQTHAVTVTTYSERVVAIPPHSIKSLEAEMLFPKDYNGTDGLSVDYTTSRGGYYPIANIGKGTFKTGDVLYFTSESSPIKIGAYITYGYDEAFTSTEHLTIDLYAREVMGFPYPSGAAAFCANPEKYIEVSGSPIKFITVIENGAGKNGTMSLTKE